MNIASLHLSTLSLRGTITMNDLIRELLLPNGLTVSFFDRTRRYFGGFYRVKMEIICKIPVLPEYFADRMAFDEAGSLLGGEVVYSRIHEQMGVPSTEPEIVLNRFVTNFMAHVFTYFASTHFPRKAVLAELTKIERKKGAGTLSLIHSCTTLRSK